MYLISKIKEKGLLECMNGIKRRVIRLYNYMLFKKYITLPIDEYSIVLESEGDCCDNAYALFDFMRQNGYISKYKITWLVDHPEKFHEKKNIRYLKKNLYEHFAGKTIKALRTCKWYIYDHCNMMNGYEKRMGQRISYLCHGYTGFKLPKGILFHSADEEFTTGDIPIQGCIDWFGTKSPKFVLGYSRLDYFFNYKEKYKRLSEQLISNGDYRKIILWMPTFRKANSINLSEEYLKNETGLPLFNTINSIENFNEYLRHINLKIVLKIHHLQAKLNLFEKHYSNIQFITDADISKKSLQLYQFIPIFDALITDYSSISTDYFLLDKPIIYIFDDIEEYNTSRGLYKKNILEYTPGDHIYNQDELKAALERIMSGEDNFKSERNQLLPKFHTYQDGKASQRILDHLGIVKD